MKTTAGFMLSGLAPLSALKKADAIVVPSWRDVNERPPERLLKALRDAHLRGAQIVGLCFGAHGLAEAGLLHGHRATTHWEYAGEMATRFPTVEVNPDVLYVEDRNVLTSAGTAAGIDACLHLVRRRLGADAANRLARRLVVAPHREGGQAQFIEQPLPNTAGGTRLAVAGEATGLLATAAGADGPIGGAGCGDRGLRLRRFAAPPLPRARRQSDDLAPKLRATKPQPRPRQPSCE